MTSTIRTLLVRTTTVAAVIGFASIGVAAVEAAPASASTTASATATGAAATGTSTSAASATASPTSTPPSSATASPSTATTGSGATGSGASTATTPTTTTTGNGTGSTTTTPATVPSSTVAGNSTPGASKTGDAPTLAVQNATDNHVMGATIPASDAAAKPAVVTTKAKTEGSSTIKLVASTSTTQLAGMDVSAYQTLTAADWKTDYAKGARFAYIKATEGTTYASSQFANQYANSKAAGIIRGAYHFAHPNADAAAQARFFVAHGGSWTSDGNTLPPLLDIEYGSTSQGGTCWGVSQAAMVSWISTFTSTVKSLTGINPAIYSTADWWTRCTGNTAAFSANPLFIAHYTSATVPGALPASWKTWSFWQWADSGIFQGDQDVFNGTLAQLRTVATGGGVPLVSAGATAASTLANGATITSGSSRTSPNGQYKLDMQGDGNLVVYGNGRALWSTGTAGHAGARVVMQSDSNLVVYSGSSPIWQSGTSGLGTGGTLYLQSSGDLAVSTTYGTPWRTSAPGTDRVSGIVSLTAGQYLHSRDGRTVLNMQSDGNLVVYANGTARWSTRTSGNGGAHVNLQSDGNWVVYSKTGKALWSSRASGTGKSNLVVVENTGDVAEYKPTSPLTTLWHTGTKV